MAKTLSRARGRARVSGFVGARRRGVSRGRRRRVRRGRPLAALRRYSRRRAMRAAREGSGRDFTAGRCTFEARARRRGSVERRPRTRRSTRATRRPTRVSTTRSARARAFVSARDGDCARRGSRAVPSRSRGLGVTADVRRRILIRGEGALCEATLDARANSPAFRILRSCVIQNVEVDFTGFCGRFASRATRA